ncbi:hypothetical protein [Oryzihumus leptocrescens]|uniref:hypothetical protein n=1 Tax=Oryzihumus leptocrescens TaxID=297536 RepID=UPI001152EA9A|nr:hypothetical protein [Oryzihumus leptocrescens]
MAASPISRNGLISEEVGYARLILGDLSGAREALEAVPAPEGDVAWHAELKQRADMILDVLQSEGPQPALQRLSSWRTQTGAALGLSHQLMQA